MEYNENISEKKSIRYAIYGFGRFAEDAIRNAFKESQYSILVAITKRNEEEAKELAELYKIPYYYSNDNVEELCNNDEIDVVFITTPNYLHLQNAIDIMKGGKHVLLEKPMAMNADECQQIIDAAEKYDRKLMIAHCMRYVETVQFFKRVIEGKEDFDIGQPITCTADFFSNGFASKRKWKFDRKIAGGGAAFDLGVHMIDILRYLIDFNIKKAHCIHNHDKIGINNDGLDLEASFLLRFENGVIGRVHSTFEGPRRLFLQVVGKKGYIRACDFQQDNKEIRVEYGNDFSIEEFKILNKNMYAAEMDAFAEAILHGTKIPIPGEVGLKNQKIIDMVND